MGGVVGRFAPSPSGRMHLGNVHAALLSWLSARAQGGRWLLRIEDIDRQRCRPEYAALLMDDLRWLGLEWDGDAVFQSARGALYDGAVGALSAQGIVYGCFCRRADLHAAGAPHAADGTPVYPGTCRALSAAERAARTAVRAPALRVAVGGAETAFTDGHYGAQRCVLARECGDFVVRRADGYAAYQLAVTVDDAAMGVTEVVRGRDLLASTHQQLFLYGRLGLAAPRFSHIPLLAAPGGRRLSKRDRDTDMAFLRAAHTPADVIGMIMHWCGLAPAPCPLSLPEALRLFRWDALPRADIVLPAAQ